MIFVLSPSMWLVTSPNISWPRPLSTNAGTNPLRVRGYHDLESEDVCVGVHKLSDHVLRVSGGLVPPQQLDDAEDRLDVNRAIRTVSAEPEGVLERSRRPQDQQQARFRGDAHELGQTVAARRREATAFVSRVDTADTHNRARKSSPTAMTRLWPPGP